MIHFEVGWLSRAGLGCAGRRATGVVAPTVGLALGGLRMAGDRGGHHYGVWCRVKQILFGL
ncbi:MAG: hypothetical protein LBD12_05550 [Clostridiales Family XIII bacterium]|nr:hypothetical protein [Clostridiales Family XIII bacterium]